MGWFRFRHHKSHCRAKHHGFHCQCDAKNRTDRFPLAQALPGMELEICCLEGECFVVRRLAEMGFIPGTRIKVVRRAPLADPVEYELRGYLISLRSEEAVKVTVKLLNDDVPVLSLNNEAPVLP